MKLFGGRNTSIATRLAGAVMLVIVVALFASMMVGIRSGRDLSSGLREDQLRSLHTSAAGNVAQEAQGLIRTSAALASSPQAAEAIAQFSSAFDELSETSEATVIDNAAVVLEAYEGRYFEPLAQAGIEVQLRDLVTDNPSALQLQRNYAVDLGVLSDPISLDNAEDGSTWSEVHQLVHPVYRDVVRTLGLVDLVLIEPDEQRVVYSVRKRPDLGTSLRVGPFGGSVLANAASQILSGGVEGQLMTDLSSYLPAGADPVGVVASPVVRDGQVVGVLALIYDSKPFTTILTGDSDWDGVGIPPTGNLFLVGPDGTVRSEPRSFLEEPAAHLDAATTEGTISEEQRIAIAATGTAVLRQRASNSMVQAITDGDTAIANRTTMIGVGGLSVVDRVPIDGVDWFLVAEVDTEASETGLRDFEKILLASLAIYTVLSAFVAVWWAGRIVRPLRIISDRLAGFGDETGADVEIPSRTPFEIQQLAGSFTSMATSLSEQHKRLAAARKGRLDVMRDMLPPAVAERIAAGEVQNIENVPLASVAVAVVVGLGDLVRVEEVDAGRTLVDELQAELDEVAIHHGLNRIKVVGDAFFAACGHDRPYIDHAPRAVAFGEAVGDVIRAVGRRSGVELDAKVGVHTGPVAVGMSGGARLVYDVWGETVTVAHHLARRAMAGRVLLTDTTQAMLPESVPLDPIEEGGQIVYWTVATEREALL